LKSTRYATYTTDDSSFVIRALWASRRIRA